MIALQVQDIKNFMSKLLIGTDFDAFWLSEANITTSVTYTIDGLLHPDFFDTQETEILEAETFTHDKTLDHLWDELVQKFFNQQHIPYEIL